MTGLPTTKALAFPTTTRGVADSARSVPTAAVTPAAAAVVDVMRRKRRRDTGMLTSIQSGVVNSRGKGGRAFEKATAEGRNPAIRIMENQCATPASGAPIKSSTSSSCEDKVGASPVTLRPRFPLAFAGDEVRLVDSHQLDAGRGRFDDDACRDASNARQQSIRQTTPHVGPVNRHPDDGFRARRNETRRIAAMRCYVRGRAERERSDSQGVSLTLTFIATVGPSAFSRAITNSASVVLPTFEALPPTTRIFMAKRLSSRCYYIYVALCV